MRKIQTLVAIVILAAGVRVLAWSDNRVAASRVQWGVTLWNYKQPAQLLLDGKYAEFLCDPDAMQHPPGYPILLAAVNKVFGPSDTAIQFVQIAADVAAVVVVYLIA